MAAPVHLQDLWPTREEIDRTWPSGADPADYRARLRHRQPATRCGTRCSAPDWRAVPVGPEIHGAAPPAVRRRHRRQPAGPLHAYPLLVLGDDITTDHISPASAIPPDSLVADYLVARGDRATT
jgi:aconitate hydratase